MIKRPLPSLSLKKERRTGVFYLPVRRMPHIIVVRY
jgi:hypothetical protein